MRLFQPPLINPTGARLVLCSDDYGYSDSADSSSPSRGTWFDDIANNDTHTFLRAGCAVGAGLMDSVVLWRWPAVVLLPEEYKLRVGGMSVKELRSQLEKYWGRGGIPGAAVEDGYKDTWVPAWACYANNSGDASYNLLWHTDLWLREGVPRLDPAIFSHWVNGECGKWLSYFVFKNHTFGVVHAWFAAFLGVIRESLVEITDCFNNAAQIQDPEQGREAFMAAISHFKFPLSFDACIEGHDEAVDGIPSLPLDIEITTSEHGVQVIKSNIGAIFPRRIWDICANTVIPATWFTDQTQPNSAGGFTLLRSVPGVIPVSHAWVAGRDKTFIVTEANQQLWPIPLPRGVLLEDVRGEMIRLGVRYAWLDVFCLRQRAQPALAKVLTISVGSEFVESREKRRLEEWEVDVPTIGAVYSQAHDTGTSGGKPVVIFMSGLGRAFQPEGWASERHWLKRAWTLQETPPLRRCLIAGLPGGAKYEWDSIKSGRLWPWNCKVCNVLFLIHDTHHQSLCTYVMSLSAGLSYYLLHA